jgi:hypothetical protein
VRSFFSHPEKSNSILLYLHLRTMSESPRAVDYFGVDAATRTVCIFLISLSFVLSPSEASECINSITKKMEMTFLPQTLFPVRLSS